MNRAGQESARQHILHVLIAAVVALAFVFPACSSTPDKEQPQKKKATLAAGRAEENNPPSAFRFAAAYSGLRMVGMTSRGSPGLFTPRFTSSNRQS